MDLGLEGKRILVTGASGGIGKAISKLLIDEGAKVAMHFNSNREGIEELLTYANSQKKDEPIVVQADLRKEKDVQNLFAKVEENYNGLDGLVNNAGIWPPQDTPITEMSLEQWENTLRTNLTSIFLCTKEFLKVIDRFFF